MTDAEQIAHLRAELRGCAQQMATLGNSLATYAANVDRALDATQPPGACDCGAMRAALEAIRARLERGSDYLAAADVHRMAGEALGVTARTAQTRKYPPHGAQNFGG